MPGRPQGWRSCAAPRSGPTSRRPRLLRTSLTARRAGLPEPTDDRDLPLAGRESPAGVFAASRSPAPSPPPSNAPDGVCALPGCTRPLPPKPRTGGRQPRFCSDKHRFRASRLRRRETAGDPAQLSPAITDELSVILARLRTGVQTVLDAVDALAGLFAHRAQQPAERPTTTSSPAGAGRRGQRREAPKPRANPEGEARP